MPAPDDPFQNGGAILFSSVEDEVRHAAGEGTDALVALAGSSERIFVTCRARWHYCLSLKKNSLFPPSLQAMLRRICSHELRFTPRWLIRVASMLLSTLWAMAPARADEEVVLLPTFEVTAAAPSADWRYATCGDFKS